MTKKPPLENVSDSELLAELVRRSAAKGVSLSDAEVQVERTLDVVGTGAMSQHLAELEGGQGKGPRPCPKCGRSVRVKGALRPRTIRLVRGEHTLHRNY